MPPSVTLTIDDIPQCTRSYPLPADEVYSFEIRGVEVRRSNEGPYVNISLVVSDHPEFSGHIVAETIALPDELLFEVMKTHPVEMQRKKIEEAIGSRCYRLRQLLFAIGWYGPGYRPGNGIRLVDAEDGNSAWDCNVLIGQRFQAKVRTEDSDGNWKTRISVYLPRIM